MRNDELNIKLEAYSTSRVAIEFVIRDDESDI